MIGSKFFGLYFHSLLVHAPLQYEVVCLRSVNTEANERMFHSVKSIAENCTNRHPDNIIPKILLHMQAKHLESSLVVSSDNKQDHRVSKEAEGLTVCTHTVIDKTFIKKRTSSFQAHLERIAHFLIPGYGIWWEQDNNKIVFYDGDTDANVREEGPQLQHFRSCTLKGVQEAATNIWYKLLQSNSPIPLERQDIRVFDSMGSFASFCTVQPQQWKIPILWVLILLVPVVVNQMYMSWKHWYLPKNLLP